MERKRAWITASVVAVTFATSALAVMANTGLLAISPRGRDVGQLTPSDIIITSLRRSTTTSTTPVVTVRYEDVYVTASPSDATPQPTEATTSSVVASRSAGPVVKRRTKPIPAEHDLGEHNTPSQGSDDDD